MGRPLEGIRVMKKLFGVMILATLPVACGTSNPNAPEMPAAVPVDEAPFSASAVAPAPPTCVAAAVVVVTVADVQPGIAYLNVQAGGLSGNTVRPVCGRPSWSVTPQSRGVRLTASGVRSGAVLEAPRGTYVVTATYPSLSGSVSGSATVSFR
jgi:hypothetical protein